MSQRYDIAIAAVGLTGVQYLALSHVLLMEPVKPSALAARLKLDASTLTRNLQPLVNEGWVEVQPGTDGRSRLVCSTPAGQAKRREGQQAWKKAQLALNAALGPERVARLHALLDECQALLEAASDEG